jgi:D-alanyl-lipoteichoic acid acyltransferase DltB (MBOAT superfamily)
MFNAIFGFVAAVYAHYALFSLDGKACAKVQKERAQYLMAEIIFFYVVYLVCFLFMTAFPKMAFELANGSFKRR